MFSSVHVCIILYYQAKEVQFLIVFLQAIITVVVNDSIHGMYIARGPARHARHERIEWCIRMLDHSPSEYYSEIYIFYQPSFSLLPCLLFFICLVLLACHYDLCLQTTRQASHNDHFI